jgi:tight adherence protein B
MVKFYSDLLSRAGLLERRRELSISMVSVALAIGLLGFALTGVWGLALCLALLTVAIALELIRVRAEVRQRDFDAGWPQVFDSFQSAAISGVGLREQLEYLSLQGPIAFRSEFQNLLELYDSGYEVEQLMPQLRKRFSNRYADLLALLIELDSELGGHGMAITFQRAAVQVRKEQAEIGQLKAKQGWVSASAKLALLAPWLVAIVLIQLPQNRAAFATELGALALFLGLALSLLAYALVNRLGQLPLPGRVLNGIE